MWWRRCKTAHTFMMIVAIFAFRFVTLATSCKTLEVLVDVNIPFTRIGKNEQNKLILIIDKLTYSVIDYCTNKPLKIFNYNYFIIFF